MNRSDTTSQPASCPAPSVFDADQWCEIYFPGVEDLLRHLAQGQADRRKMVRSLLFGSRTMVTLCVICFICVPGCATPAIFLMKSGNFGLSRIQTEPVSAKADRLPLIQPIRQFGDAQPIPFAAIGNRADLFERAALRGGIENVLFAAPPSNPPATSPPASILPASIPPVSNAHKTRRGATRAATVVTLPVENDPQPSSPPPSLLEKLFDAIVSVSQSPRQT
jgi:hypothetical protein